MAFSDCDLQQVRLGHEENSLVLPSTVDLFGVFVDVRGDDMRHCHGIHLAHDAGPRACQQLQQMRSDGALHPTTVAGKCARTLSHETSDVKCGVSSILCSHLKSRQGHLATCNAV